MPPRILLVQQEWPLDFMRSTRWGYFASLAYVAALEDCGAEVMLLTSPWIPRAPLLLAHREFDQVWLNDLVHLEVSDPFFEWIRSIAPVRVGLVGESLEHTPEELRETPSYGIREQRVRSRASQLSHLLLADEADARRLWSEETPTLWMPGATPRSFVQAESEVHPTGPPGFIGSLYSKRTQFFEHPTLQGLIVQGKPQGRTPELEARYLELADHATRPADSPEQCSALHQSYNRRLIDVRREIHERYLLGLRSFGCTLNPPSIVKTYAGRVYESISQGVPVISWRIPERPGNERLFEIGSELLAFEEGDFEAVRRAIDTLIGDREAARSLALRARTRLLADHTLEARCATALHFIQEH